MDNFNFENALKRLEEITNILENEELSLDESLNLYEEGIKIKKQCYEYLKQAEGKIYKIIQSNGMEKLEEILPENLLNNDTFNPDD